MSVDVGSRIGETDVARARVTRRGSAFYLGVAAVMCVTVFVGFAPSFYLRPLLQDRFGLPPLPSRLVVVHGVVFSAWMLLLLLQTSLVAARRVRWHRRTGVGAAIVAALMVIIGVAAQVAQTHRTVASGEYETTILLENGLTIGALLNITLFGALTAAAVHFRRRPDVHRRLVVLANIPLLLAAVGRIIFIFGLPQALLYVFPQPAFIAALATNDLRTDRRVILPRCGQAFRSSPSTLFR